MKNKILNFIYFMCIFNIFLAGFSVEDRPVLSLVVANVSLIYIVAYRLANDMD